MDTFCCSVGISQSVCSCAQFYQNMKNKVKHGIFYCNIPSIGEKNLQILKKKC